MTSSKRYGSPTSSRSNVSGPTMSARWRRWPAASNTARASVSSGSGTQYLRSVRTPSTVMSASANAFSSARGHRVHDARLGQHVHQQRLWLGSLREGRFAGGVKLGRVDHRVGQQRQHAVPRGFVQRAFDQVTVCRGDGQIFRDPQLGSRRRAREPLRDPSGPRPGECQLPRASRFRLAWVNNRLSAFASPASRARR